MMGRQVGGMIASVIVSYVRLEWMAEVLAQRCSRASSSCTVAHSLYFEFDHDFLDVERKFLNFKFPERRHLFVMYDPPPDLFVYIQVRPNPTPLISTLSSNLKKQLLLDETAQMMERAYYEKQKLKNDKVFQRLAALRHDLESIPMQKQCHRYRWRQTETMFDVEIPMPKPCEDDKLWLVVESEQLQVAVKTDETFGAVVVRGRKVRTYRL